jgi:hypothetical protein
MSVTVNGTSGLTFNDGSSQNTSAYGGGFAMRNRIINGAMVIDQRNAGASVTPTSSSYTLDRWYTILTQSSKFSVQQNAGSVTPPVGFSKYIGITSLSSYSVGAGDYFLLTQSIEGFNTADFGFGTANASTVTLSFWVRSSLTGTFGGSLVNSGFSRSYPFTYTISAANTWEQKTVTIAGDTTGTWIGATNGIGLRVQFGLGVGSTYSGTAGSWAATEYDSATGATSVVGTNGATFYITGVQLEKGSTATSFDYRPYGTELALCQRYYYKIQATGDNSTFGIGMATTSTVADCLINFPVSMRTAPSSLEQSGTATQYRLRQGGTEITCSAVPAFVFTSTLTTSTVRGTVASGLTAASAIPLRSTSTDAYLAWSAEL